MFTLKLNDTGSFTECDWVVVDRTGHPLAGFAGSNAAERWINAREAEARQARIAFRRARAARRCLARSI